MARFNLMIATACVSVMTACASAPSFDGVSADPASAMQVGVEAPSDASEEPLTHTVVVAPTAGLPGAVKPASVDAVRSMLQVRHAKDLPTIGQIALHDEPVAALKWLVQNDDTVIMRVRAAERLGHFGTSDDFLLGVLGDVEQRDSVRAGALRGLAALDVQARPAVFAALVQELSSPSRRMSLEAFDIMAGEAGLRADLMVMADEGRLPSFLAARAARL